MSDYSVVAPAGDHVINIVRLFHVKAPARFLLRVVHSSYRLTDEPAISMSVAVTQTTLRNMSDAELKRAWIATRDARYAAELADRLVT